MRLYGNQFAQRELEVYALKNNKAPLMLKGPKGTGKATMARNLATKILGCTMQSLDTNPDFVTLNNEKGIKVDEIRELLSKISLSSEGERRVVLIDDASEMTVAAQNCLLKTVEEDNERNVFIFIAHREMLPTIHSRTQHIEFYGLSDNEMLQGFVEKNISVADRKMVLLIARGSIGSAYDIVDNYDLATLRTIYHNLTSLKRRADIFKACNAIKEKDSNSIFELFKSSPHYLFNLFIGLFEEYMTNELTNSRKTCFRELEEPYCIEEVIEYIACLNGLKNMSNFTKNDFFDFLMKVANKIN